MLGWAEEHKIALIHIQPGKPMQNGHVESFHGRLRDECLNVNWPHANLPRSHEPIVTTHTPTLTDANTTRLRYCTRAKA